MDRRIRRLETRIAHLETRIAFSKRDVGLFIERAIELIPEVGRFSGGVREVARLAFSSLRLTAAELNVAVKKNREEILYNLEVSFKETMQTAFQPFVSVKAPPKMTEWNPRNLLDSTFEFKGKSYSLKELLKHDSVTGQGAYKAYNSWVSEYGVPLDLAQGITPNPNSGESTRLMKKIMKKIKKSSKLFFRFLNVWLKMSTQIGLVTGIIAGLATMEIICSSAEILKWFYDKFNSKVEKSLKNDSSHLFYDPERTASFHRLSHMRKITLILESAV